MDAVAEGTSARLLTAIHDAEALQRLSEIVQAQAKAREGPDHRELVRLHWEFHRTICISGGNPFLLDLWTKVSNVIRIYSTAAISKTAVENNRVFLDYFTNKLPEQAEEVLRSQIIAMSYIYLQRPIAAAVKSYVTVFIDGKNKVRDVSALDHDQLARLAEN